MHPLEIDLASVGFRGGAVSGVVLGRSPGVGRSGSLVVPPVQTRNKEKVYDCLYPRLYAGLYVRAGPGCEDEK